MCHGEKYNNKADIWMLGCVLFELCTLRKPFKGDNIITLMNNIKNEPVPEIPKVYSNDMKSIVKLLTQKDDSKRPFIREILEHDIVIKKMKEFGVEEIESPMMISRKGDQSVVFNIKLSTIPENKEKDRHLAHDSSYGMLGNPSSTASTGFGKNSSQGDLLDNNDNTRMRKKLRVPEKINRKYDSMGQQAFGKVIEEMNLNHIDSSNLR